MKFTLEHLGTVAGIVMPFWNIPLIWRIIQRKTAEDISLAWLFGVWGCIVLMLPAALVSSEVAFKSYAVTNAVFFSAVVAVVLMYRKKR
jgi:uncharacterized protein with PQ loop repeat